MLKKIKSPLVIMGVALVPILLACWFVAGKVSLSVMNKIIQEDQQDLNNKADYLAGNIKHHLHHLQTIPQLVGKEDNVLKALSLPVAKATRAALPAAQRKQAWSQAPLLKATNNYLGALAQYMRAGVIFVLNPAGECVLASNASAQDSFVGTDYSSRDYYKAALAGGTGYQYAMGKVSNVPGLFFSSAIVDRGKLVGIAVIKVNLSDLSPWVTQANAYLVDEYGVVVLAYDKNLEMRVLPDNTVGNLSAEKRLLRYKRSDFPPLAIGPWQRPNLPSVHAFGQDGKPMLLASKRKQPELGLYVTQELHQAVEYGQKRLEMFVLFTLASLLLLALTLWRRIVARNRQRVEKEIENNERRLKTAQQIAHVGSFEWNPVSGELRWTDEHFRLWGLAPQSATPNYELFRNGLHPDDVARLEETLQQALRGGRVYNCEHRVIWPDGNERHIHGRGEVVFNAAGQAVRMSGTVQDVTERKQAERELIAARDEANRANRTKSEFLSNMSHELRTPMNAILGFGQVLEYDNTLSVAHKNHAHEIVRAGHHLLELINEILDMARIESGRLDLSLEPVEIFPLTNECVNLIHTLANKRDIKIHLGRMDGAAVRADRTRLKQVLLNLLSNAIKYNHEGGSVTIDVQAEDTARLRIRVTDTGPGISAERQKELFQPFNRLGAENSGVEGTGIGLSISRRLVEMMSGTVGVTSETGAGSTFWIELPLESATPSACDGDNTDAGRADPSARGEAGQYTVLYIEDNPANLKLVVHILGQRKHIHLITAHTPELGIELARTRQPDLILLDINLPNMDGYQVMEVFRNEAGLKHTPVVAISANAMPRDINRGLAAGFQEYLTKPLDVARFNAVLDKLLGAASAR